VLVDFSRNLIYVKTWKTGGTSVEGMLQESLWNSKAQPAQGWKIRWDGFATPRPIGTMSVRQKLVVNLSPHYPSSLKDQIGNLKNHSSPREISRAIGEGFFSRFAKVVCVRNPFSLMVSGFFFDAGQQGLDLKDVNNEKAFTAWMMRRGDQTSFQVGWQEDLPDLLDSSWTCIRQEYLEDDFRSLASDLGLRTKRTLNYKSEYRPPHQKTYEYLYSKYARDWVATRYRKWIDAFDYSF
jgi:hypothetical protein